LVFIRLRAAGSIKCNYKTGDFRDNNMMELMQGLPDNVLGIIGSETITGEDYTLYSIL
jgi:hypothetical protein